MLNQTRPSLSHDALLRRHDVERLTAQSRATLYRKISQGAFPKPIKIGPGSVRWRASDIDAWLAQCIETSEAA